MATMRLPIELVLFCVIFWLAIGAACVCVPAAIIVCVFAFFL
jgi:hypothetical protein